MHEETQQYGRQQTGDARLNTLAMQVAVSQTNGRYLGKEKGEHFSDDRKM